MGLSTVIGNAVNTAFNAVGDLKVSITITKISNSRHDANVLYVSDTSENVTMDAIRTSYKKNQVDNTAILPNDLKFLVQSSLCVLSDGNSFRPTTQDRLTYNSVEYSIKNVDAIPGDGMYIIQARGNEL